jgi:coenzyme F420-dependent oxidoreductase
VTTYDVALSLPTQEGVEWSDQRRLAAQAEKSGYDLVLAPEAWGREAFTRLGYLAAETDRVHLGTGIIPVHSRSPALIAQAGATLDELTGGRAVLGLGLSGPRVIEQWHGAEFQPALRRQRETIEIIGQVLAGEELDYEGRLFDVEHFELRFQPVRDEIPIYVAATGETNVELVGGFADGWLPNRVPVSALPDLRRVVDRGAELQDRDPDAVATVPYVTTCVLDDGELARRRCREGIAFYVGAMGEFHYNAVASHGFRDEADAIRDNWRAGDREAAIAAVDDDLLDEIAVAGSPEEVLDLFEAYEPIADTLVVLPPTSASVAEISETVAHVGALLQ